MQKYCGQIEFGKIKEFFLFHKRNALFDIKRNSLSLFVPLAGEIGARLASLRDAYSNQRCFIMGNGPSLNKMDLSVFEDEYVWGSNKCYLLFDRISWRPQFYVGVDRRVIPDIKDEIAELIVNLQETKFFFPFDFYQAQELSDSSNVYWFFQQSLNSFNLPFSAFSVDPSRKMYSVSTVTVAMIQLAVYLGFDPIYLIGCDTNYSIPTSVYEEDTRGDLLLSTQDDDPNHFSKDYFGAGSKWHAPHVENMLWHYEQTKLACDKLGVNVFNATVGGMLETFPRIDYQDLF